MKQTKISLLVICLLLVCISCQKTGKSVTTNGDSVPQATTDAFKAIYPDAHEVDWQTENKLYSAEFEKDNIEYSAVIDADGKIIQTSTEQEIDFDALPDQVKSVFLATYGNAIIKEIELIRRGDGTKYYEFEIKSGEHFLKLLYGENGELLEEEIDDDLDDDSDDDELNG